MRGGFFWCASIESDLTLAIVKRGCRDQDVFDLSERLDCVEQTGDGSLNG